VDDYVQAVRAATQRYALRVLAAYKLDESLGRRATETWGLSVDTESINDVASTITGAYLSGKRRGAQTLPPDYPPITIGFRTDDMNAVNRLRDFNSDEIRKLGEEFRVLMRLRGIQRMSTSDIMAKIREDLEATLPKVERLGATEVMRAANEGRINEYIFRGVIKVRWVAGKDACEKCRRLHGEVTTISDLPTIPHHPSGRCTVVAEV
jgi:SPP1 gp7 family putative phage head morphogenesis protein